jgi:hypothetical protein
MKKKLNTESITNELAGGASAFFRPKTPTPHTAPTEQTSPTPSPAVQQPLNDGRSETTNVPTNERTFHRRKIRHTFDIFDDQLLSLKEIAIERQKVFGERVLLGDLVQEALDLFISKERNKE